MKPVTSVMVVNTTVPASARVNIQGPEYHWQYRADHNGDSQVEHHGQRNHQGNNSVAKPQHGGGGNNAGPDHTIGQADNEFPGEQPASIGTSYLTQCHCTNDQGQCLAAGNTAHAGDNGHQNRQGDDLVDGILKQADDHWQI